MADICILFSKADEGAARFLADKIKSLGKTVEGYTSETAPIEQIAASTGVFVTLWSPSSGSDESLLAVASRARDTGKLLHARMLGAAGPAAFASDPAIDLTGWKGEELYPAWRRMIAEIDARLGAPAPAPEPVAEAPPPAPEPVVEAPPPAPEPVAEAPPPAPEPVVEAPPPTLEPVVEAPPPAPEPVAEAPPPAPEPVVEAPPPAPEPVVEAAPPTPEPVAEAPPSAPEPVAEAPPPAPEPVAEAPPPAPEPVAEAPPPAPEPVAEAAPPAPEPAPVAVAEAPAPSPAPAPPMREASPRPVEPARSGSPLGWILGLAAVVVIGVGGFLGYQGYQSGSLRLPFLPLSAAAVDSDTWDAVDKTDPAALEAFLADAPDSAYLNAAQSLLAELEAERFDAAMQAIDAGPVEAFLAAFPNSPRAAEARMRLDRIRGEAPGSLIPLPGAVRAAADPSETLAVEPAQEAAAPDEAPAPAAETPAAPAAPPAPEVRGAPL